MSVPEEKPTAVFVIDSKNFSHGLWTQLHKLGIDAHIYVASEEGNLALDPRIKGNSWNAWRDREIDAILRYKSENGLKAIVIPVSMFLEEQEMQEIVKAIRARDTDVPIVLCGKQREDLQQAFMATHNLVVFDDGWVLDGRVQPLVDGLNGLGLFRGR